MSGPMLTRLIGVLASTLVVHLAVAIGFLWQQNSAQESQKLEIQSLRAQWDDEDFERKKFQEEELLSRYGTTKLDRIAFDPRLDIKLALQKLCEAVMPSEYLIEVSVDRFTEFSIYVNVYNMPRTDDLAEYLKEVFSQISTRYVYQVIFTDDDNYWIIDRSQLTRIGDWERARLKDIKRYCF